MSKKKWFMLAVILLVVLATFWSRPKSSIQKLLSQVNLAPLPASATNFFFHQWNGFGTGEKYIRFQLSGADLNAFITNSPALKNLKPTIYDIYYQHVPYPKNIDDMVVGQSDYFPRDHKAFPPWFDMTIKVKGRKYKLFPHETTFWVVINEATGTIYIWAVRG